MVSAVDPDLLTTLNSVRRRSRCSTASKTASGSTLSRMYIRGLPARSSLDRSFHNGPNSASRSVRAPKAEPPIPMITRFSKRPSRRSARSCAWPNPPESYGSSKNPISPERREDSTVSCAAWKRAARSPPRRSGSTPFAPRRSITMFEKSSVMGVIRI